VNSIETTFPAGQIKRELALYRTIVNKAGLKEN
jgi:hypothetical protein